MAFSRKILTVIFTQKVFSSMAFGVLTISVLFLLRLSPALPSSETIRSLKEKIAELNDQIQNGEAVKKNLERKENQLTDTIKKLKSKSKTADSLLLNLRIENSLKQLRSILVSLRESEKDQTLLRNQLIKTNTDLKEEMEKEINQLIQSAQEAFRRGNEFDADHDYNEALQLMEEHKQFQIDSIINTIVEPPRVEILLDGKETPDKLRELTDFARNDIESFKKEIRLLQENKNRIQKEITLRKNLIKYSELIEREENSSINHREPLEQELLKLEKTVKKINLKILKFKEAVQTLAREIKKIENQIQKEEKR
ncbi:MAG: hypothetical protein ACYDBV_10655 [Nitrospiria bacterium]